ncbi:SDR family NAD(P)-dependent oxidoreductase [Rhodococcus erythropolis]
MDLGLSGNRVIVTGGASHIGRAIVLGMAGEGAHVVIVDRDVEQADATAKAARARGAAGATVVGADLSATPNVIEAMKRAMDALGGVDTLVNNVGGASRPDFFSKLTPADWEKELTLNLMSPTVATSAVLPQMVAQKGGCVVSTSSVSAWGEPRSAVYGAAKAGVMSLMRALAKEHGRDNIRFNSIAPGPVVPSEGDSDTFGSGSVWTNPKALWNDDEQLRSVMRQAPLRRLATAEDIANSVLFFASPRVATALTGQVLAVSCGFGMPS